MIVDDHRERDIFIGALEHEPGEPRSVYLEGSCAGDASLLERVESLLAAYEEGGEDEFLEPQELPADILEGKAREVGLALEDGKPIRIGNYEVRRLIGRGSMGTVYEAQQINLKRPVALKVLRGSVFGSGSDMLRFRQEAEATANLHHPNIVSVYEVGEIDDHEFFSMTLLQGGTLASAMSDLRGDLRRAVGLLVKVARALDAAHEDGIIHRDIKPSNVLLDLTGEPYVADFGLAKQVEAEHSHTLTGQIVGTPSFMAPEQASRGGGVDKRADVYGVGAILYQMLTGLAPYRGQSLMEVLEQLRGGEVIPPSKIEAEVDRDLETIAMKCLERDPGDRYGSAAELADELQRWLAGEEIAARPLTRKQRLGRWVRRNPSKVAGWAALLAAAAGLAAGGVHLIAEQQQSERIAEQFEEDRRQKDRSAEAMRRKLYAAEMMEASILAGKPDVEVAAIAENLRHWEDGGDSGGKDLRGWEWHYLDRLTRRHLFMTEPREGEVSLLWRPGHDQVLVYSMEGIGVLDLWNWKTGERIREFPAIDFGAAVWMPDGRLRITGMDLLDRYLDLDSGDVEEGEPGLGLPTPPSPRADYLSYDPTGRYLAVIGGWHSGHKVFDRGDGNREIHDDGNHGTGTCIWSSDGEWLAFRRFDGVHVWNLKTGEETLLGDGATFGALSMAWHPEKPLLAVGGRSSVISVYSVEDNVSLHEHENGSPVTGLAWWHGDNGVLDTDELLAAGGRNGAVKFFLAQGRQPVVELLGHSGLISSIRWRSAESSLVASGSSDGTVRFWDIGQEALWSTQVVGTRGGIAWSPNGDRVALKMAFLPDAVASVVWLPGTSEVSVMPGTEIPLRDNYMVGSDAFDWNPASGQLLSMSEGKDAITIWTMGDGEAELKDVRYPVSDPGHWVVARWNPDGTRIAIANAEELTIVSHPLGERIRLGGHPVGIADLAWGPTGRELASVGGDDTLRIWRAIDGEEVLRVECGAAVPAMQAFRRVVWEPGGSRIAVSVGDLSKVKIWDRVEEGWVAEIEGQNSMVKALAWSPDRSRLAVGGVGKEIRLWDMETYQQVAVLRHRENDIEDLKWSPGGEQLISTGYNVITLWNGR